MEYTIRPYHASFRIQMLKVWERSVLATHQFLLKEDFNAIKSILAEFDFQLIKVFCLVRDETVVGFIGMAGKKVEMLFLDPNYIGKGFGKRLMEYVIQHFNVEYIDVNEQNERALQFYRNFGFEPYERTEVDDLGKGYPLLKMKRQVR